MSKTPRASSPTGTEVSRPVDLSIMKIFPWPVIANREPSGDQAPLLVLFRTSRGVPGRRRTTYRLAGLAGGLAPITNNSDPSGDHTGLVTMPPLKTYTA